MTTMTAYRLNYTTHEIIQLEDPRFYESLGKPKKIQVEELRSSETLESFVSNFSWWHAGPLTIIRIEVSESPLPEEQPTTERSE